MRRARGDVCDRAAYVPPLVGKTDSCTTSSDSIVGDELVDPFNTLNNRERARGGSQVSSDADDLAVAALQSTGRCGSEQRGDRGGGVAVEDGEHLVARE